MVKRMLLVGLLGISVISLIGNEASARVCVLKNADGSCKYWSGSVECGIGASGIGNVIKDPVSLVCVVDSNCPTEVGVSCQNANKWLVACANPGINDWTPPGINVFDFTGTLSGSYTLLPKDVLKNGNAYVSVFAEPGGQFLLDLVNLGACPNSNYSAVDATPCAMMVTDQEIVLCGTVPTVSSQAKYWCELPNCETLGWDLVDQKFERRQYECTRIERTEFSCP